MTGIWQQDEDPSAPAAASGGKEDAEPLIGAKVDTAEAPPSTYEINVVEANPSITDATIITIKEDGSSFTVADLNLNQYLLVSADHVEGDFALLAVDALTNQVEGMSIRNGEKLVKVKQMPGGSTTVTAQKEFVPPADWKCGVDEVFVNNQNSGRRLRHPHAHHHHDHDHNHDHADDHDYDHHDDFFSKMNLLGDATDNVGVSFGKRRARELYPTDSFPQKYTYEVDLYIEIDSYLVANNGNLAGAVNYVNALISAISAIYEEEIDTHCEFPCVKLFHIYPLFHYTSNSIIFLHPLQKVNVVEVAQTAIYDGITTTIGVLDLMESTYGRDAWHYTSGNGIDLHHALLGNPDLRGGVANLRTVCNPQWGFGMSGNVAGSISNIGGTVYWDLVVVAHELGHNFGAQHTHDESRVPKVDSCGITTVPNCGANCVYESCPANMGAGDATIMSYCHVCPDGNSTLHCFVGLMCPIANIICQHL